MISSLLAVNNEKFEYSESECSLKYQVYRDNSQLRDGRTWTAVNTQTNFYCIAWVDEEFAVSGCSTFWSCSIHSKRNKTRTQGGEKKLYIRIFMREISSLCRQMKNHQDFHCWFYPRCLPFVCFSSFLIFSFIFESTRFILHMTFTREWN